MLNRETITVPSLGYLPRMTGEPAGRWEWELTCTTREGLYLPRDEGAAAAEGDPEGAWVGGRELQRPERRR